MLPIFHIKQQVPERNFLTKSVQHGTFVANFMPADAQHTGSAIKPRRIYGTCKLRVHVHTI